MTAWKRRGLTLQPMPHRCHEHAVDCWARTELGGLDEWLACGVCGKLVDGGERRAA